MTELRRADGSLLGRVVDFRFVPDPSFGPADAPQLVELVDEQLRAAGTRLRAMKAWIASLEANTAPGAGEPAKVLSLVHRSCQIALGEFT